MKQIVLGILCCAIAVYTIVSCLSIYSISSRRNEMENCVAQVLGQSLEHYYANSQEPEYSDAEVAAFVQQDIISRLHSDSKITIDIYACNMELGILSVGVTECFFLPNGMEKVLQCTKTIIAE